MYTKEKRIEIDNNGKRTMRIPETYYGSTYLQL